MQANQSQTFGGVVSDARRRAGKSQKELAGLIIKEDGAPISAQYLNDLERDRRNPPAHLIDQFAASLGLPREYLDYVAGQMPPELLGMRAQPDRVEAAFRAFRRELSK
jgi:transcriptional regulator with XRE-family HTH domain